MEKNKSKAVFITIIVLLVLVIAGLVCYIVLDKNNENKGKTEKQEQTIQNTPTPEAIQTSEETEQERELTTAELEEIEEYLKNGKVNFLASEYNKPEDANLYFQIIYSCFDEDLEKLITYVDSDKELKNIGMTDEDIQILKEFTRMAKITAKDLNEYLNNNLGVSIKDVNLDFIDKYSSDYDAYYFYEPTDAFIMNIMLISGTINKEGLYVIKYEGDYEYKWTLTLRKDGENYKFVSNINEASKKIGEIKETEGLTSKKLKYNDSVDCVIYYKNNELYYAELISENDDNEERTTYYFDNSECFACVENVVYLSEYYDYEVIGERIYEIFIQELNG